MLPDAGILFCQCEARVASQLNHIVTVSQVSATDIATDFGVLPSVIRVVPNGVDTSLFRPLPQNAATLNRLLRQRLPTHPQGFARIAAGVQELREERPSNGGTHRPAQTGGDTEALIRQLG